MLPNPIYVFTDLVSSLSTGVLPSVKQTVWFQDIAKTWLLFDSAKSSFFDFYWYLWATWTKKLDTLPGHGTKTGFGGLCLVCRALPRLAASRCVWLDIEMVIILILVIVIGFRGSGLRSLRFEILGKLFLTCPDNREFTSCSWGDAHVCRATAHVRRAK